MSKIQITPSLEDEIFRRDKFTCRQCSAEAPSVFLVVDTLHDPDEFGVEADNLITLCSECYNRLHDKLQITPLEMMKDRRHQLDQLLRWKNDNYLLGREQVKIVTDYINNRMFDEFHLDRTGQFHVEKMIRNYGLVSVLNKIDTVFFNKIKFVDNHITRESAVEFFKAINGYLYVSIQGDKDQAIYYIAGLCRKRFGDYCRDDALKMLREYVGKLSNFYSENEILSDLRGPIQEEAKNSYSMPQWRSFVINHGNEMIRKKRNPFGNQ